MDALTLMDALQVHAAAAAVTAVGTTFYDVAVGFPAGKGRSVRIFYDGEREPRHAPDPHTLNSELVATGVVIRGYWPLSESATKRQRVQQGEMDAFVRSFRTRVVGDKQLGGASVDLELSMAEAGLVTIAGNHFQTVQMECVIDWTEYTIAP